MQTHSVRKVQRSLVGRLRRGLLFPIGLLIFGLLLSFAVGIFAYMSQQSVGNQKAAIQSDLDSILNSMVNQETGIRGYVVTNNQTFLTPFTDGRPQYIQAFQQLKNQTQDARFANTHSALTLVDEHASAWYNNFALVQVNDMKSGNLVAARSEQASVSGKTLFDAFRASLTQLQMATNSDLSSLQARATIFDITSLGVVALLSCIALVLLSRAMAGLMGETQDQLADLKDVTEHLGTGDFSSRVGNLAYSELDQLGQTLNTMATALQEQREALQERDIMEQVLQLNSVLTKNIELDPLVQEFLHSMLTLLNLQIGCLYLYNEAEKSLELIASHGLERHQLQETFQLGEGLVGEVARSHKPLYLSYREHSDADGFKIKTSLGHVLPASLYHLPLVAGSTLLGVLMVGSVYPMNENARNVLDVVIGNVTSALSNTQAYRRIQDQAEELEKRNREQANINTMLRHQRDDLTILNAALEEANKARSQFLSTMSHELRTPLTSIIGFSQILLRVSEREKLSPRQQGNIERIHKNGQHLLSLINDVLDLAKIEAGRMDVHYNIVNLPNLLSNIVEETQSIASERGITLLWNVEDDIERIETDPIRLRQILLNLISNALKFTEKGEVMVDARHVPAPTVSGVQTGSSTTQLEQEVEQVAISVRDTGIGISQETQERIFEAFYQVDGSNTRKYSGTGLGLSIVRQLTTLLGGKIELQSEVHQGSTFTLYLPVKKVVRRLEQQDMRLNSGSLLLENRFIEDQDALLEVLTADDAYATDGDTEPRIVLAIDDNPDVLQLIDTALENSHYRVVSISDPTKAMEMVQMLHPSAVTLDVMMPQMNGWQVLHQIRSNPITASIPVIILTVLEDRSAAHVLGADEYLVKPVERDSLIRTLNQVSVQRTATERIPVAVSINEKQDTASHLLIVKNEPTVRETLERILSQAGLDVQVALQEQDVVDIIENSRPDVILLRPVPSKKTDPLQDNTEEKQK